MEKVGYTNDGRTYYVTRAKIKLNTVDNEVRKLSNHVPSLIAVCPNVNVRFHMQFVKNAESKENCFEENYEKIFQVGLESINQSGSILSDYKHTDKLHNSPS